MRNITLNSLNHIRECNSVSNHSEEYTPNSRNHDKEGTLNHIRDPPTIQRYIPELRDIGRTGRLRPPRPARGSASLRYAPHRFGGEGSPREREGGGVDFGFEGLGSRILAVRASL